MKGTPWNDMKKKKNQEKGKCRELVIKKENKY